MATISYEYDNVKNTFPKKTDVSGVEADFSALGGRLIVLEFTGSPSPSGAEATDDYTEGDYIVCLGADYVGLVTRVVDGNVIEVEDAHGLTDTEEACAVIKYSTQFEDYTILNGSSGAALIKGKGGDYMTLPVDSADGGQGWPDDDGWPIIVDAATNSATVQVKGVF